MATPGIFISHSHYDNDFCHRLHRFLKERLPDETSIFFDDNSLSAGDDWMQRIQKEVIALPIFIVILSRHSVIAPWVRQETNLALSTAVNDMNRRVIPVQIDQSIGVADIHQLAPLLTMRQIIELGEGAAESQWEKLVQVVRGEISDEVKAGSADLAELERARTFAAQTHDAYSAGQWLNTVKFGRFAVSLRGNERDAALWGELGIALIKVGETSEGLEALDTALGINRFRGDLWREKAQVLASRDDLDGAVKAWDSAVVTTGSPSTKLEILADQYHALERAGRWPQAQVVIHEALELAPDDEHWLARELDTLEHLGQHEQAAARATLLAPRHASIVRDWAQSSYEPYSEHGYAQTLALVDAALVTDPDDPTWLQRKREILVERGQHADALEIARTLSARPDASVAAWLTRARLASAASNFQEVDLAFERAERLGGPTDPLVTQARQELLDLPEEHFPQRLRELGFVGRRMNGVEVILPPMCPVPEGPFTMGSMPQRFWRRDYDYRMNMMHRVQLPAFEIGMYPVTVAEYACAVRAGAVEPPVLKDKETGAIKNVWDELLTRLDAPMTYVSWPNALAYVIWLTEFTGQAWRLPTEAEWEKAARGTDARDYPWGEPYNPVYAMVLGGGSGRTPRPVGTFGGGTDSPYHVRDLVGSVRQWCSSKHEHYPYTPDDGRESFSSAYPGWYRVRRGPTTSYWDGGRLTYRDYDYTLGSETSGQTSTEQFVMSEQGFRLARQGPPSLLVNYGRYLIEKKQYQDALRYLEPAANDARGNGDAWAALASAYAGLGRDDDALAAYTRATELAPTNATIWSSKGWMLRRMKRYTEALAAYQRAASLKPKEASHWANVGLVLIDHLERPREALQAFERAIALNPKTAWYSARKARALAALQRDKDALAACQRAIKLAEKRSWPWDVKAQLLYDMGKRQESALATDRATDLYRDALRAIDRAIERTADKDDKDTDNQDKAKYWNRKGEILLALRQRQEALEAFDRALSLDPALAAATTNRAQALQALGRASDDSTAEGQIDLAR